LKLLLNAASDSQPQVQDVGSRPRPAGFGALDETAPERPNVAQAQMGIPAVVTRLTSMSLQSSTNCPGARVTPSQTKVLVGEVTRARASRTVNGIRFSTRRRAAPPN
jgi:hypothetical protein